MASARRSRGVPEPRTASIATPPQNIDDNVQRADVKAFPLTLSITVASVEAFFSVMEFLLVLMLTREASKFVLHAVHDIDDPSVSDTALF